MSMGWNQGKPRSGRIPTAELEMLADKGGPDAARLVAHIRDMGQEMLQMHKTWAGKRRHYRWMIRRQRQQITYLVEKLRPTPQRMP